MPRFTPGDKPAGEEPTTVGGSENLRPGKLFAWFELQRELDNASTWLAQDYSVGRQVEQIALKILPRSIVRDKAAVQELKDAIRRRTILIHPYILRVYDLVESKGGVAIQMEYRDGQSLSSLRLARLNQVFEVRELQKWVEQLCEALEYAHHGVGLVHGDIASGNLIVDPAGNLQLKNFGIETSIAQTVRRSIPVQDTREPLPYRSPQRAPGEEPGISDDLYSLGAALFELLTGQPPFSAGDVGSPGSGTVHRSMTERRAELGIVGELIPRNWEETVAACLAEDPAQRPQSAAEVQKRLKNATEPSEIPSKNAVKPVLEPIAEPNSPARTRSLPKRRFGIVGIIFLVVLGLAIGFFSFRRLTERRVEKAVSNNVPTKTNDFLENGSSRTPLALRSPTGADGKDNLLAAPTHSAEVVATPLTEASPAPSVAANPAPSAVANPTPSAQANPAPSAAASPTLSAEVSSPNPADTTPAPSGDVSARVSPSQAAIPNRTAASASLIPFNQQNADAIKEDVVRRINAMPGVTAEKKANLIGKMNKARSMERLVVIPFESGRTNLRRSAADELVQMFDTPEMRDKLSDPTTVLVVAGYADPGGAADANLRISRARAENVGRILKEQAKLLNAMQTIGMGGTELLDTKRPDMNRAVEIWAVVPL